MRQVFPKQARQLRMTRSGPTVPEVRSRPTPKEFMRQHRKRRVVKAAGRGAITPPIIGFDSRPEVLDAYLLSGRHALRLLFLTGTPSRLTALVQAGGDADHAADDDE